MRSVLSKYGARHRPSAPLDTRWLGGGWSSHFEFFDPQQRRLRCDFVSRPPRVPAAALALEVNALQQLDRDRLVRYQQAAEAYLHEFRQSALDQLPLEQAHEAACQLAEAWLPPRPLEQETP